VTSRCFVSTFTPILGLSRSVPGGLAPEASFNSERDIFSRNRTSIRTSRGLGRSLHFGHSWQRLRTFAMDDAPMPAEPPSPTAAPMTPPTDPSVDVADPADDKTEFTFCYELKNWATADPEKIYSPWVFFAGFRWRLLIFPRGNAVKENAYISIYLENGGPCDDPAGLVPAAAPPVLSDDDVAMTSTPAAAMPMTSSPLPPAPPPAAVLGSHETDVIRAEPPALVDAADMDPVNIMATPTPTVAPPLLSDKSKRATPNSVAHGSWSRPARFWLSLKPCTRTNRTTPTNAVPISKESPHTFREKETDWGFREFCHLSTILKEGYGAENGSIHIEARVKLEDPSPDSMFNTGTWDSRKVTGFVGFKNQGATCYLNSLLQTLYMVGAFRRAVYDMPLPDANVVDAGGSEMSYALQKVFYELQHSSTTVKTKNLTKSFGWDNTDAFTQHDVQELNRIMCDHLHERMKKIRPNEPTTNVSKLFQGKILNYIECVNVDYTSTREEDFYDLSLNVKGCRNIYESFDKYCEVETLDGQNKYQAEGFSERQEARKGVWFSRLPPVLHLHLKRFEYDLQSGNQFKINDRFEFPTEIDLSSYVTNSDESDMYLLHSVLVHVGYINGGHYYAFIRPTARDAPEQDPANPPAKGINPPATWYKFDDDMVTIVTEDEAVADNFGSGGERDTTTNEMISLNNNDQSTQAVYHQTRSRNYAARRLSNAYMLQYIRKDQVNDILMPAKDSDISEELSKRIVDEQTKEELRKKEQAEQHLYLHIAVATDRDIVEHTGVDAVPWEKIKTIRVERAMRLRELKCMLQELGLVTDARLLRLWKCEGRQNESIRPECLLANGRDNSPIAEPRRGVHSNPYDLGYQTRSFGGLNSAEETVKLYVEDFLSPYCLGAGSEYVQAAQLAHQGVHSSPNADTHAGAGEPTELISMNGDEAPEVAEHGNKSICSGAISVPANGFNLVGSEMLLFFKRYIATPAPRLEWIGHSIVDHNSRVRDLVPILLRGVSTRRELNPSTVPLKSAKLWMFEECAADLVEALNLHDTFHDRGIPQRNDNGSYGKGGDIIVFMDSISSRDNAVNEHRMSVDGKEIPVDNIAGFSSHKYVPSLPLGGRSLPTPREYYDYLLTRVKVEFKPKYPPTGSRDAKPEGIVLELLRHDTYAYIRTILAMALGVGFDADHLRFFPHDFSGDTAAVDPLRHFDSDKLDRILPSHSMASMGSSDYRVLWYERTEFKISEYENMEELRVTWRPDGGDRATPVAIAGDVASPSSSPTNATVISSDTELAAEATVNETESELQVSRTVAESCSGAQTFSVLVPYGSKYEDVATLVRSKVGVDDSVCIRLLDVRNFRVSRFLELSDTLSRNVSFGMVSPEFGSELRAEPVLQTRPDDMDVSIAHIAKDKQRAWQSRGRPTYFGVPIILQISKDGETVGAIRERIRTRLNVPVDLFESWKLAEVSQSKMEYMTYLEDDRAFWTPDRKNLGGVEICSLAIEHHGSVPTKRHGHVSRVADKPLKIRG
jgi:ubiquitin C-terminal hydrolase